MKVICNVNGIKKAYVQRSDISFLFDLGIEMPVEVYASLNNKCLNVIDTGNPEQFLEFSTEEEMKFFWNLDYIIDYRDYKDLSIEGMSKRLSDIYRDELKKIASNLNAMRLEEKKESSKKADYKIRSIEKIITNRKNEKKFDLPIASDFLLRGEFGPDAIYQMHQSLEPNVMIVSRVDDQEIYRSSDVPQDFYQLALAIKKQDKKELGYDGEYDLSIEKSDDSKKLYLVFTRKIVLVEDKGVKKMIKSIIKKTKF